VIRWNREASRSEIGAAVFSITLAPEEVTEIEITIACEVGERAADVRFADVLEKSRQDVSTHDICKCRVVSSNDSLNRWFNRSAADLHMMLTDTPDGVYPYAGIPWFSTPFGRDGIITALETLWAAPDIARGVLQFLASTQATAHDDAQDAEPGKILHEMRQGEMAALGEIPFGKYYGSADSTPLFVALAAAYFERTVIASLSTRYGRMSWPRLTGWTHRAIQIATGLSNTSVRVRPGWFSRDGRIPAIRCSTRTALWLSLRSPCVRFRDTRTKPGTVPQSSRELAAI